MKVIEQEPDTEVQEDDAVGDDEELETDVAKDVTEDEAKDVTEDEAKDVTEDEAKDVTEDEAKDVTGDEAGVESEDEVQQEDADGDNEVMETDDITEDETKAADKVESKDEEVVSPPENPYKDQLSQFKPHSWQLEEKDPETCPSLEDTKFTMVDTQSSLEEMMLKLKEVKEMAIALEQSYRSFRGMVCLLQISTRTEDFLIDSLILKDDLKVLNDVCIDSNILKVLHGSVRDLEWLQKDFGVYVINMFDTQKAARILQEDGGSMLGILKKYCNVEINKELQRADWNIRPLPDDMVKYGREGSHYLLYIHDVYRNALLKRGNGKKKVLEEFYTSCTSACEVMWFPEKHVFRTDSYLACYKRIKGKLNTQQLECFRLLYEWRHNISQEKDESTGYTLPNRFMMRIAKALPKEPLGIIECCNPVPELVQEHLEDVHNCVIQGIKNVPVVDKNSTVNIKKSISKGKPSQLKRNLQRNLERKKMKGKHAAQAGSHSGKKSLLISPLLGERTMLRGGAWNRGRGVPHGAYPSGGVPYGAYPSGGPSMRGGPGLRNFHGRGSRHMGPPRMHPYGHPPPHQPLPTDGYYGFGGYNSGGNPYDVPFNPYNHPGAGPYNTGRFY